MQMKFSDVAVEKCSYKYSYKCSLLLNLSSVFWTVFEIIKKNSLSAVVWVLIWVLIV